MAKAEGLSAADLKINAVGGAPARQIMLKEGKIDAGMQPLPLNLEAEALGFTNLGWAGTIRARVAVHHHQRQRRLGPQQPAGRGRLRARVAARPTVHLVEPGRGGANRGRRAQDGRGAGGALA